MIAFQFFYPIFCRFNKQFTNHINKLDAFSTPNNCLAKFVEFDIGGGGLIEREFYLQFRLKREGLTGAQ